MFSDWPIRIIVSCSLEIVLSVKRLVQLDSAMRLADYTDADVEQLYSGVPEGFFLLENLYSIELTEQLLGNNLTSKWTLGKEESQNCS